MGLRLILLLVKLCIVFIPLRVYGSAVYNISPLAANYSAHPPTEEREHGLGYQGKPPKTGTPRPSPLHYGSVLHPPMVSAPHDSAPVSPRAEGLLPSMPPSPPTVLPPHELTPLPKPVQGPTPSIPRRSPRRSRPDVPVASPPGKLPWKSPSFKPTTPGTTPSSLPDHAAPKVTPFPSSRNGYQVPLAASPKESFSHLSPLNRSPIKGSFPVVAPSPHKAARPSAKTPTPYKSSLQPPAGKRFQSPALSPSISIPRHHHSEKRSHTTIPAPSYLPPPPSSYWLGPVIPQAPSNVPVVPPKKSRQRHRSTSSFAPGPSGSAVKSPFPSSGESGSPRPVQSPTLPSGQTERPLLPPKVSPLEHSPRKPLMPIPSPVRALPPPPPNQDCTSLTCTEPLTNTPPGSPCGCVWPIQVGVRLSVALYTFFPLVSELADEIAAGVFMKQSQVRIMGANAANQQPEKTVVLIDLVPLGEKFDNTTAFLTYEKFWHKQVTMKTSFFGDYEVLYVRYPGLPPSPPLASSSIGTVDAGPYSGGDNNGRAIKPLGVDVRRRRKGGLGGSMIAIIVLSSSIFMVLCIGAAWLLLLKSRDHTSQLTSIPPTLVPSLAKPSGAPGSMLFGSGPSSVSLSFGSSIATYTGSAKTFSAAEIERATCDFDPSRILGEGGFGRVYEGILDDGISVAVKVLKRDDQQGGREFLAEVEMLSRLHHRNLVKLIGICTEDNIRSLVYELIPNGSVESHLHGVDKEAAPLDWGARMKIALGAARGLAYLHEDSSPRVIHRDFKSSNILLEHDYTPKVSDFGLARTALDEGNKHISTRVMGTFGYVAPEYAMTGHLLVKSDVYSYGVVLLELLTGRKPVDMSRPQGQENLVAWARPLLTSKEGLEMIIDPDLGPVVPFDSVAKVAAIASMCVQPEVSHRPFMGEVVQALKLVCNECDETKEMGSESYSQEDLSIDMDTRINIGSGQLPEPSQTQYPISDHASILEARMALSALDVFSSSVGIERQSSGSFRRHSSSGPLRTGRSRQFWQRLRGSSRGSMSEHGLASILWMGSR
ncbi:receptor-like serine/threonine-protein kinase ALE2 isoform X2 [Macadamia integrifolia]|uniref:receptor-like serine/threonine-protein kinase ALE2 isoform X2 n=1 Tax=Macadamia integrifolia TaxID=60698 RepID=UPI001C5336F6|nr:receptor-like serine/threonine-protein kinase ALE2 isoform X2 [Macadamia integrifolia]